jgi:methionyl aminopeptidase
MFVYPKKLDDYYLGPYDATRSNTISGYKDNEDVPEPELIDKVARLREAAECHRKVRHNLQPLLKPGVTYSEIYDFVESETKKIFSYTTKYNKGQAFPTGISNNNIAAHDTAQLNDQRTIGENDVCKIDIGVHSDGYIIDSAFTLSFNPVYDPLIEATIDATWSTIELAGPDAILVELSQNIKEVIESYEIELNGKTYQINPIRLIGCHNIDRYTIHAGKLILCTPDQMNNTNRMEAGELYAIETFATTGTGICTMDQSNISHYMRKKEYSKNSIKLNTTKNVLNVITKEKGTLPFCSRWLQNTGVKGANFGLNDLFKNEIIEVYPPIVDKKGTYTSQCEHTVYLHENGKEVLSYGGDY